MQKVVVKYPQTSGKRGLAFFPTCNILSQVKNVFGGNVISQYDYVNDELERRVRISRSGSAMREPHSYSYGYNARNELTAAAKLGGAQSSEPEYQYAYDDIGNRVSSFELGTNSIYAANELNQYVSIGDVVTVPSSSQGFTPQYDADGNQTLIKTATGVWSVTYNGENRPVHWSCGSTNIFMSFDRLGRRVEYLEEISFSGATVTNRHHRFVYDGFVCVQRLDAAADNAIDLILTWDPVEPLATRPLMIEKAGGQKLFLTHDGNKNASELVSVAADEAGVSTHYEYAPFGAHTTSVCSISDGNADSCSDNPFRFSSEYYDDALGLVYYNFRHYNPHDGRWLSPEPEWLDCASDVSGMKSDGNMFYLFAMNDAVGRIDLLGLKVNVPVPGTKYVGRVELQAELAQGQAAGKCVIPSDGVYTHVDVTDKNNKKVTSIKMDADGNFVTEREGFGENKLSRKEREAVQNWARSRAKKLAKSYISSNKGCCPESGSSSQAGSGRQPSSGSGSGPQSGGRSGTAPRGGGSTPAGGRPSGTPPRGGATRPPLPPPRPASTPGLGSSPFGRMPRLPMPRGGVGIVAPIQPIGGGGGGGGPYGRDRPSVFL